MTDKQSFTIKRLDVNGNPASPPMEFSAALNPASYAIARSVKLSEANKTDGGESESLTLDELVFDGTGVVPNPLGPPQTVQQQMDAFDRVVRTEIQDDRLAYPLVRLVWGALHFVGRVKCVNIKYTLFAPDGTALRARVSLSLAEHKTGSARTREPNARNLTRQLTVTGGTRLPELSFSAYNDPNLALAVARINGLTSIRNLPPGLAIAFPTIT